MLDRPRFFTLSAVLVLGACVGGTSDRSRLILNYNDDADGGAVATPAAALGVGTTNPTTGRAPAWDYGSSRGAGRIAGADDAGDDARESRATASGGNPRDETDGGRAASAGGATGGSRSESESDGGRASASASNSGDGPGSRNTTSASSRTDPDTGESRATASARSINDGPGESRAAASVSVSLTN